AYVPEMLASTVDVSFLLFFFSSRRRHTRSKRDWSSDVCSSDLHELRAEREPLPLRPGPHLLAGNALRRSCVPAAGVLALGLGAEIGRASCRERVKDTGGDGV